MLGLFSQLSAWVKRQEHVTDNAIFRMEYMFTTVMLLTFSLIITATQFLGNPIECINDGDVPINVINTYCWISTTFTMPDAHARQVGIEVPAPGLINGIDEDSKRYYTYYQWVVFVLFLQAILCYIPKWLWDMWEGSLMSTLILGLNYGMMTEEDKNSKKKTLIDYMLRHIK
ncbi:unnamed protein product, partial [Darwinula stevensoni]